jgi:hypothetical protein
LNTFFIGGCHFSWEENKMKIFLGLLFYHKNPTMPSLDPFYMSWKAHDHQNKKIYD